MATRPGFYILNGQVTCKKGDFEWAGGFAVSQKKKNVARLHEALGGECLEVSTKSDVVIGTKLSAFNLKLDGHTLENIFQSSKVFENGGPYRDLLNVSPKEANRDQRLKSSGNLKGFEYDNYLWALNPKTCFYDYLYCKAARNIEANELKQICNYEYFTDIEFNPAKSINTQARSVAIVKLMLQLWGEVLDLSPEQFLKFHSRFVIS